MKYATSIQQTKCSSKSKPQWMLAGVFFFCFVSFFNNIFFLISCFRFSSTNQQFDDVKYYFIYKLYSTYAVLYVHTEFGPIFYAYNKLNTDYIYMKYDHFKFVFCFVCCGSLLYIFWLLILLLLSNTYIIQDKLRKRISISR